MSNNKGVVVVTGSSGGIGEAICKKFLSEGFEVHGIDVVNPSTELLHDLNFYSHINDIRNSNDLPDIDKVEYLINCAGTQNSYDDIGNNLIGLMNTTEKYGLQYWIKSIVNMASVSAHNGCEFPKYVASKGGVLAYTVWTAKEIATYENHPTCNSLSFGGVLTSLNSEVICNEEKFNKIMDMTPLRKWATAEECAEWTYFVSVVNKSMSGQDIIIDNMETRNNQFVW